MDHTVSSSNLNQKNPQQVMLEMRSTAIKFTIAAANPLLAEKLAAPTTNGQHLHNLNTPQQRQQMAQLTPKVEKGKCRNGCLC